MLWVGHCYRYRQRSRKPKAHCDEKSLQRNPEGNDVVGFSDTMALKVMGLAPRPNRIRRGSVAGKFVRPRAYRIDSVMLLMMIVMISR
jgi:hypothetical protein